VAHSAARLEVRSVSKAYNAVRALSEVSFDLQPGEVHALLGHNGAGKSTLVKILSGLVQPDSGSLTIDGTEVSPRNPRQAQALGVALVDQELSLVPTLTVAENMLLGSSRANAVDSKSLRLILDSLGMERVGLDTNVAKLPLGEQQLVEIARALSRNAKILILDEPTATLSDHEIDRVFAAVRKMAADGRSIIYVSHRLGEILNLCQRATVFRDGHCIGTESIARMDRDSLVEMMLGHLPVVEHRVGRARTDGSHSLTIEGLSVLPRLEDFALTVAPGEIVGIAGQVGCGAGEVMRALAGLIPEADGSVTVRDRALRLGSPLRSARSGILYTTSDRKQEGLFLGHTIAKNIVATRIPRLSRVGLVRRARESATVTKLLALTGIAYGRRGQGVGELSGGNQQKVLVARSLQKDPCAVLLFEEPTRGVDIGGRAEIHDLIRGAADEGISVIFSSTELDEILDLSDTVVTMFGGVIVDIYQRSDVTPAKILTDMTHGRTKENVS
jgi:ABC-type sugar transport system ATPase subunit